MLIVRLAERILAGPQPLGGRLRDDHVARVLLLLALCEVSSAQQLDAHRVEVVAGGERHRQRMLGCGFGSAFFGTEAGREDSLVQRKILHDADGCHAGQTAQSFHEGEVEARPRRPVAQLLLLGGELECEDVLGDVARVDVAQLREAAQQEPGPHEEQKRERRLRHDENVARPAPAKRRAARALAQPG
jgi:hypothetical protein